MKTDEAIIFERRLAGLRERAESEPQKLGRQRACAPEPELPEGWLRDLALRGRPTPTGDPG